MESRTNPGAATLGHHDAVIATLRRGGFHHIMQPGYDYGDEFNFGLELILDGLQQRLDAAAAG